MAQEEEDNASKVQISKPNHLDDGPKEVKIPPSKRSNPTGAGIYAAETNVLNIVLERTHTIRHGTDTSMTPPKMLSPK